MDHLDVLRLDALEHGVAEGVTLRDQNDLVVRGTRAVVSRRHLLIAGTTWAEEGAARERGREQQDHGLAHAGSSAGLWSGLARQARRAPDRHEQGMVWHEAA